MKGKADSGSTQSPSQPGHTTSLHAAPLPPCSQPLTIRLIASQTPHPGWGGRRHTPLVRSGRGGWRQWLGTEPFLYHLWAKEGGGEQGRAAARDQTGRCAVCSPHSGPSLPCPPHWPLPPKSPASTEPLQLAKHGTRHWEHTRGRMACLSPPPRSTGTSGDSQAEPDGWAGPRVAHL